MKIIKSNIILIGQYSFKIYPERQGSIKEILTSIMGQLEAMQSWHSKSHVLRFDLHVPVYSPKNIQIKIFFQRLVKRIQREYDLMRVGYGWAREISQAEKLHYHCFLILNGHQVRHPHNIQSSIQECWQGLVDNGSYHWPLRSYYNLHRGDTLELADAFFRLSYLAKVKSKELNEKKVKVYGMSRIKKRF
ncbi:YagK/YfjJ domain-containing protein [Gallaecimonas mangrovi]|uniref:YagK/YfjJ domain-containing protein n=1 Tax=Gallaecimonas mangrovi TaxID=2291597 RepID=UPI000E1FC21A|nr:inovirus-type Gp2 protein [Gallaecimonas mangrovi]